MSTHNEVAVEIKWFQMAEGLRLNNKAHSMCAIDAYT